MRLILGSQSPRRKEILSYFSIPFIQTNHECDEKNIIFKDDPIEYVKTLSVKKAESLSEKFEKDIILTADTIVHLKGKIFNKPKDEQEAFTYLSELSGKWHQVFTALTITQQSKTFSEEQETKILLHPLSSEQISIYLQHFAYTDKAGGYAIQQGGGIIVSKIEGCFYNVMGLPINTLRNLLSKIGIDLWKHLKIF